MPSAYDQGLNVSTKAGEGEAYQWRWDGVQRTLNQIAQRDFLHEKQLKDEYGRAQLSLQQSMKGLRSADMPLFNKALDQYRNAGLSLMSRQALRDPQTRAELTQQKDEAFANAMSIAERSKEATKQKASYYDQWMKDGGLNASEDFKDKMGMYDNLNVDEIRQNNFDNPMNFFSPKDDTPKDLSKLILGDIGVDQKRTPIYDEKGRKKADWVDEYYSYKKPLAAVASDALQHLGASKNQTGTIRNEYANANPKDVQAVMDQANSAIIKSGGVPLPNDYKGYYTAKWINQAQQVKPAGDRKTEYDEAWKEANKNSEEMKRLAITEAGKNSRFNKGLAFNKEKFNAKQNANQPYLEQDFKPLHAALKEGNREVATKALSAIAENNPDKPVPFTASRLDILDLDKRRALLDQLGIDANKVKYVPGKTPQETRDNIVKAVVSAINAVSSGSKINMEDLSRNKIVAGLIHVGQVNEFDDNRNYKGTKQTRLPVLFNANNVSADQFQAAMSNTTVKKKKPALAEQAGDLSDAYNEDGDPVQVAAPAPAHRQATTTHKTTKKAPFQPGVKL